MTEPTEFDSILAKVLLRVHCAQGDLEASRQLLLALEQTGTLALPDILVVASSMKKDLANITLNQIGKSFAPPCRQDEAFASYEVLKDLGRKEEAFAAIESFLTQFSQPTSQAWFHYGRLLARDGHWRRLSQLARTKRSIEHTDAQALGHYWLASAALAYDRLSMANYHINAVIAAPPESIKLRQGMALELYRLNQRELTQPLIRHLVGMQMSEKVQWLNQTTRVAQAGRDQDFLLLSSMAYHAAPDFLPYHNHFVVALLATRAQPTTALKLIPDLTNKNPDFLPYRLNQIHAICLNEKWEQADQRLQSIAPEDIKEEAIQADFQLAQFRLAVRRNHSQEILTRATHLNRRQYLPSVNQWISQQLAKARS